MDICYQLTGSAMSEEAVNFEVDVSNLLCPNRLDSDACDQIECCSDGRRRVSHLLVVRKVLELRAESVVALNEWCA